MNRAVQVISIGNAFEILYAKPTPLSHLSELARADERHFSQKSTYWRTRHGDPSIVICTDPPSDEILSRIFIDRARPDFICPIRQTSSICADLCSNRETFSRLVSLLRRDRPVHVAPYIYTPGVKKIASLLQALGFHLVDSEDISGLVNNLCNKIFAHENIFKSVDTLRRHRPRCLVARSDSQLAKAANILFDEGVPEIAIKSARAVGGSGVFFLPSERRDLLTTSLPELLTGRGQNDVERSAPYLIEERVSADLSPTVDIDVTAKKVSIEGIALQRLFDNRYYNGFYHSVAMQQEWWFELVEYLASLIGRQLASCGYVGPANIDFVISNSDRSVTLIELNPRRSALVDGFSLWRRLAGDGSTSVSVVDYLNLSTDLLSSGPPPLDGVLPILDGGLRSNYHWVGLLAEGDEIRDSEKVLGGAIDQLQDRICNEIGTTTSEARGVGSIHAWAG
jgi:hypothetical protein